MAVVESGFSAKLNENDNKKLFVKNIEKTGEDAYKVTADIGLDKNSVDDRNEC